MINLYNEAKVLQQRSEDVFVYIARYFEKFIGKNYKVENKKATNFHKTYIHVNINIKHSTYTN